MPTSEHLARRRAISGPLTRWRVHVNGAAIAIAGPFFLDVSVDRISDPLVSSPSPMLVDHRGPFTVVTHASHQVPQASATMSLGRDVIPGVAKIVEVQARQSHQRHYLRPPRHLRD